MLPSAIAAAPAGFWDAASPIWNLLSALLGALIGAATQALVSRHAARREQRSYARESYAVVLAAVVLMTDSARDIVAARLDGRADAAEQLSSELVPSLVEARDASARAVMFGSPRVGLESAHWAKILARLLEGTQDDRETFKELRASAAKIVDLARADLGITTTLWDRVRLGFDARRMAADRGSSNDPSAL